jgi:serine/threonine protein kinase
MQQAQPRRGDYPSMSLSHSPNQRHGTRRRQPAEIEHDNETSTNGGDTSEEDDRVHDNEHRKVTFLWSRFLYVPGCRFCQSLKQISSNLFQCLQGRKRSGALPVWTAAVSNRAPKFSRWVTRRRRAGTSLLAVVLDLTVVVYFTFCCPVTHGQHQHHHHYRRSSRPKTDQELNRLPILLSPSGSISSSSSFSKRDWALQNVSNDSHKPSALGGIEIESLRADRYLREIRADDHERFEREREKLLRKDNHEHVPFTYWHQEELSDLRTACGRPKWMEYHFSTCNDFHHIDLTRNYDETLARLAGDEQDYDNYYISRGYYRDVWANMKPAVDKSKTILKTMRYEYDFNYRDHYNVNREALVMERLTTANNIIDLYGHCGTSVLVEAIPFEVEDYVIPGTGYLKQGEVRDEPPNPFSPLEKLEMAVEMAESIAVLHGFKDGVIVHNDIQLRQWMRTREGRLKLGDFNRAKVLDWNLKKQQYCKFSNGAAFGNVRFALSSYRSSC